MQHSPAVNLLDAIRRECRLNIAFIRCPGPDGEDVWLIGAMDENGEAWFSEHAKRLIVIRYETLARQPDVTTKVKIR